MHRMQVFHDDQSFRDQTDRMFREMEQKMGFGSLQDSAWSVPTASGWSTSSNPSFFELRPTTMTSASGQPQAFGSQPPTHFETLDDATTRSLFVDLGQGQGQGQGRLFRMSFDMRQYDPADIVVRSENDCLVVEAKHVDDQTSGSKVSNQFCRRIQLPAGVDPALLTSTLSADNILTVQAPVPPSYNALLGGSSATAQQQLRASPVPPLFAQQQQQQSMMQPGQLQAPAMGITASGRLSPRLGPGIKPTFDMPTFSHDEATGRRRLDLGVELGSPYTADDVTVRLEGRRLVVSAKHENRDDSRGRVSTTSTQKQFDLSEDVDPATIRASMNDTGRLAISAIVVQQ